MSGITGLCLLDGLPVSRSVLERMTESLEHRGRDAKGVWTDGSIGLGRCLLRTTPESFYEQWPTTNLSGSLILAADARIDNRDELIASLGLTGRPPCEISDADLILESYGRWRGECPQKLLGDFAFAIWDDRERELFCARDHFGVKPFYYHHSSRIFAFASEMKALFHVPDVPRRLDETRVADHLEANFEDRVRTFYRDISRLPAAHSLTVRRDGLRLRPYWSLDPSRELRLRSEGEYAEAFRGLFVDAVRARLRSAFPVGSLLSGGLDSSSIVCTARKLLTDDGNGRLHTFSAIFPDLPERDRRQIDERAFIDAVLAPGGVSPHFVRADRLSPLRELERVLRHEDEAVLAPNLYMHWALYETAHQTGVRVLLDGIDGDTVVSHGLELLADLARTGRWRALVREAVALSEKSSASFPPRRIIWEYGVRPLVPGWVVKAWRVLHGRNRSSSRSGKLVSVAFGRKLDLTARARRAELSDTARARNAREVHWRALTSGLFPATLEMADKAAAAFSLEPRYPFLDRRVIEFCLAVPAEQKLQRGWTRMILRRAMADVLPEAVCWRTRKANLTPNFVRGLRQDDRPLLDDVILNDPGVLEDYVDVAALRSTYRRWVSQSESADDGLTIYGAVTLACWLREWDRGHVTTGTEVTAGDPNAWMQNTGWPVGRLGFAARSTLQASTTTNFRGRQTNGAHS